MREKDYIPPLLNVVFHVKLWMKHGLRGSKVLNKYYNQCYSHTGTSKHFLKNKNCTYNIVKFKEVRQVKKESMDKPKTP